MECVKTPQQIAHFYNLKNHKLRRKKTEMQYSTKINRDLEGFDYLGVFKFRFSYKDSMEFRFLSAIKMRLDYENLTHFLFSDT